MKFTKWQRRIFKIACLAFLLILPRLAELHYLALYYGLTAVLLISAVLTEVTKWYEKSDKRFFRIWERRNKGFWFYFFPAWLEWFLYTSMVVILGQLFGNGRTPMDVVHAFSALSGGALVLILIMLLLLPALPAAISWFENEKRYQKICGRDRSTENETDRF